jgi:hypothetical protein
MNTELEFTRALVRHVLETTPHTEWTVQGFGFLRTYFGPADRPKQYRLNLWDRTFTVPNVSTIHDHPWDFKSLIVAGQTANQRYDIAPVGWTGPSVRPTHSCTTIRCGVGGGMEKSPPEACTLIPARDREDYKIGDIYRQRADEIHETFFLDGSITLNQRVGDTERARVFWPYGTEWVDAIPHQATKEEVDRAVAFSLGYWF